MKKLELAVVETNEKVDDYPFMVINVKSGIPVADFNTRFMAADFMFSSINASPSVYWSAQSKENAFGVGTESDVEALYFMEESQGSVNLALYKEQLRAIVSRVMAEAKNIKSPKEVLDALDGCVMSTRLKQIAMWGFRNQGGLV